MSATNQLRRAVDVTLHGGGSVMAAFKYHWWALTLDCGHVVERRIRWTPIPDPPRGFAALHQGVPLTRLPAKPNSARCEECGPAR